MNSNKFVSVVLTASILNLLSGCGGGGGGGGTPAPQKGTISGIAAVGAPIVGANVSLLSSSGELLNTATTSATGSFSLTYTLGKSGPYLLESSGGTYVEKSTGLSKSGPNLHSIIDGEGTANITPLTEMIVTQTLPAGNAPASVFANCKAAATNCTSAFAALTSANVTASHNILLTALGNVVSAVGGGLTDFIHQPFVANGISPMDVLLETTLPSISIVNNISTITFNTVNGSYSLGISNSGLTPSTGLSITNGVVTIPNFSNSVAATVAKISANASNLAESATDLANIQTRMNAFATLLSTASPTQSAISAFLGTNFLLDGMDSSTYLKQLTTVPSSVASGDTFAVTLATVFDNANQSNLVTGTKWVNATHLNSSGSILGVSRLKFVNNNGTWLMAGNERTVNVTLRAESGMKSASPATFSSDVNISVDPTTAALAGVSTALVSGGSIVSSSSNGIAVYSNSQPATPTSAVLNNLIVLCDATLLTNCTNALDSSVYTITLKNGSGAVVATYNEELKKAPIAASSLTASMFPSFGSSVLPSIQSIAPGASINFSWNTPSGLSSNWVDFTVWDSNGVLFLDLSELPSSNTFSGTLPAFTPPAANSGIALSRLRVSVQASDGYGRQYVSFINE
jgi:hypothetical protein